MTDGDAVEETVHVAHVPVVRGDLWPRDHDARRHGRAASAAIVDDVFSKGFICPKGSTLKQLHEDPDRLRTPLVRRDGVLEPATWDEAFAAIDDGLGRRVGRRRPQRRGALPRQPERPHIAGSLFVRPLLQALGTHNLFSASARSTRCPSTSRAAGCSATPARCRSPTSTAPTTCDARREPARIERQPVHRARLPRTARGDPRARRQRDRGGRPAPLADGRGRRRAPLHPTRHRRDVAGSDRRTR